VAGAAVRRRLTWLLAEAVELIEETPEVRTIVLRVPSWPGHLAGQHVDVRLTAEDGYQAQRSYSIATPPHDEQLALTVERVPDGEVSTYMLDELRLGDRFELRGPIGGYFVWTPDLDAPLALLGAGSGIVPLMAMIRERARSSSTVPTSLLLSSRTWDQVIYRSELERLGQANVRVVHTLTRTQPPGWRGYARRVDREMLQDAVPAASENPRCFVCGPTGFVEAVASGLVEVGHDPSRVKTERFGPSGA
jgi:ferredoxin-NADP reductase